MSDQDRSRLEEAATSALAALAEPSGLVSGSDAVVAVQPALRAYPFVSEETRSTFLVLEQALRLAALFHDLGHLPFSHDFEFAVNDLWRSPETDFVLNPPAEPASALHEQVGHQLARLLMKEVVGDNLSGAALFSCAYQILDAPSPLHLMQEESGGVAPSDDKQLWSWLHSLIDGEVDADRCDYMLRDGRNFGFAFANYDLVRLVDHMTASWAGSILQLSIRSRGVSALESFLLGRMRSYQYGVFHHKVVQLGQAFQAITKRMLDQPTDAIQKFIDDLQAVLASDPASLPTDDRRALLDAFGYYDDIWWMNLIREYNAQDLASWAALVLRRAPGPVSLWKRPSDFPKPLREFNEGIASTQAETRSYDAVARLDSAVRELASEGVLVALPKFQPWRVADLPDPTSLSAPGSAALMIEEDRDGSDGSSLRPISEVSPVIRRLWDVWMESVQMWAFHSGQNAVPPDATSVLERIENAVREEAQ